MLPNADYLGAKTSKNEPLKYCCEKCDYSTSKLANWKRHLKTKKHNATQMLPNADYLGAKTSQNEPANKWICGCGKSYKHKQSFYRHKSKCTYIEEDIKEEDNGLAIQENVNMKDVLGLMNDLIVKNNKLTEKVIELSSNQGQSIHGDHNNQIQNNFNIQLFLNEDCKNALSIQDFAKQLKLTMNDLSLMNENEPKAITNIIVKNLKDYTEVERPFHHHKKKWYIKDKNEGWDQEGKDSADIVVKHTKTAVSQKAGPTFVENNPDWLTNQKKGEKYAETVSVAMKEVSERNTNKILKSLKSEVEVGKE